MDTDKAYLLGLIIGGGVFGTFLFNMKPLPEGLGQFFAKAIQQR